MTDHDIVTDLRQRHANVTGNDTRITTPIVGPTIFSHAADEIERLRSRLDEERAWREDADFRLFRLKSEIECRIEHGADSNMHLEGLRHLWTEGNL